MVPEVMACYLLVYESAGDMSTHIKASLLGNNLTIFIVDGAFSLGGLVRNNIREHRV